MLILEEKNCQINLFKVGSMRTNCYVVIEPKSGEAMIIDPGDEGDFLSEEVLRLGVKKVSFLVLTHAHFDHLGGLLALKLNFPLAEVAMGGGDEQLLARASQSAWHWQQQVLDPPPPPDRLLKENDHLFLGADLDFRVIACPGHTPGGIGLFSAHPPLLFSGDTLFAQGSIGRTDLSYSDAQQLRQSLEKLWLLPDDTLVLPGHGNVSSIKIEREWHESEEEDG